MSLNKHLQTSALCEGAYDPSWLWEAQIPQTGGLFEKMCLFARNGGGGDKETVTGQNNHTVLDDNVLADTT